MGFLLPELDEAYGGAGASLAYQLVVQDELAKAEVPANTAVHNLAAHYILDYGTEAQKRRWLPRLASGELLAGIALTEPGCGSDLKALRTRARRDGDALRDRRRQDLHHQRLHAPTCWWWRCAPATPAAAASR